MGNKPMPAQSSQQPRVAINDQCTYQVRRERHWVEAHRLQPLVWAPGREPGATRWPFFSRVGEWTGLRRGREVLERDARWASEQCERNWSLK
jgi:hypothetical protein